MHALKAVREGEDPSSAIKNFVNHCKSVKDMPSKEVPDTESEINKFTADISRIVVSDDAVVPNEDNAAVTLDTSADIETAAEIESLKQENEKLKEAYERIKEQHQAKVRECKQLTQERERLSK